MQKAEDMHYVPGIFIVNHATNNVANPRLIYKCFGPVGPQYRLLASFASIPTRSDTSTSWLPIAPRPGLLFSKLNRFLPLGCYFRI